MNPDEKRHVQQYVGRAKLFIANINQRRQTLFNITRCLVDQQREFLEHGVRHLRPLQPRRRRPAARASTRAPSAAPRRRSTSCCRTAR